MEFIMKKIIQPVTIAIWFGIFLQFIGCGKQIEDTHKTGGQRIISLSPNITEILFALNLGEQVVGVTDFCEYPPAVRAKTRVGGYLNPNMEVIVSLKPTLVVMLNYNQDLKQKLMNFAFPILLIRNDRIEDVFASIDTIGSITGRERQADSLIQHIQTTITKIQRISKELPKRRVLFCIGRKPEGLQDIYAVGSSTFLNQLLEIAGAENIFEDISLKYPKVTPEAILTRNPEIIIETWSAKGKSEAELERHRNAWKMLPSINAVKNEQIFLLTEEYMLIPGPRMGLILEKLFELLHPSSITKPSSAR